MNELENLARQEGSYTPSAEVQQSLKSVTLICVVGGVGVGKNYLMKKSGLPIVGRVTSRPHRPDDDPKVYRYFTNDELIDMIHRRKLVQYAVDLGNNVIYGSTPEDYVKGGVTLADIWHWSVDDLKTKGFGQVRSISVLTPWGQWKKQLEERFKNRDPSYKQARLEEALKSLDWTRQRIESNDNHHTVIINDTSDTDQSIMHLTRFSHGESLTVPPDTLELIDNLKNQLKHF